MAKKKTKRTKTKYRHKSADIRSDINQRIKSRPDLKNLNYDDAVNKQLADTNDEIMTEYKIALQNRHITATEAELNQMDIIDVRNCRLLMELHDPITKPAVMNIMQRENPDECLYQHIPCFTEGVLLSDIVEDSKIHFKVNSLDLKNRCMELELTTYVFFEKVGWFPVRSEQAVIKYDKTKQQCVAETTKILDSEQITRLIPVKDLKWSPLQKYVWQVIVKTCHKTEQNPIEILMEFIIAIRAANCTIEQSRKHPGETESKDMTSKPNDKTTQKHSQKAKLTPDEIVHEYNGLRIICKTRHINRTEGPRNYTTPVWTAKGHVRRYKSGKVAYIPPMLKHRKTLTDNDSNTSPDTPKSIIKVK